MSSKEIIRDASHAGSWYTDSGKRLDSQLDGWLDIVTTPMSCIGPKSQGEVLESLPVEGARVIIAPHAGYSYSGPAAAWAYKAWDISKAKRVFLLGPSHHHYLTKAALTNCTHYATPMGNLNIDRETTSQLHDTGAFEWMTQSVDEDEHSLEMHLPYIFKILTRSFGKKPSDHPPLVPIMVGSTSSSTERRLAKILAPFLADPSTAWVISSDFAHWGLRFRYTHYQAGSASPIDLSSSSKMPTDPPIHESIKAVDFECINACEDGSHDGWLACLEGNGNTVCGRHPIAVIMAAVEEVRETRGEHGVGAFKFVRYERSSEVIKISDSSVSYASAFAVI